VINDLLAIPNGFPIDFNDRNGENARLFSKPFSPRVLPVSHHLNFCVRKLHRIKNRANFCAVRAIFKLIECDVHKKKNA
jgi:hypothetical protein